jgi:hypothetical protein
MVDGCFIKSIGFWKVDSHAAPFSPIWMMGSNIKTGHMGYTLLADPKLSG